MDKPNAFKSVKHEVLLVILVSFGIDENAGKEYSSISLIPDLAGTNRIHSDESNYLRFSPCTFTGHFVQQCSEVRHGRRAFFKVFISSASLLFYCPLCLVNKMGFAR